jgi:LPPG:FO 2-phospho-L-lactate transferase
MVTLLSGGTGTPKLLAGSESVFHPSETIVIGNTGDDIELGGHLICPDIDTVLFLAGGELDRQRWWGIEADTSETHDELRRIASAGDLETGPQYLPEDAQTSGRGISRHRRFSGVAEFMYIGDRDRAVHITRTSLLDAGHSLTAVTERLAEAFDLERTLLPMSDDPVATMIHTPDGPMHFQEWWVGHNGCPQVNDVVFRGSDAAAATDAVRDALSKPVVIGPSNPITSIGPMVAIDGIRRALEETPVVAVSPFVEDTVFSGPAADLMAGTGHEPSTAGVAACYPFVDAFVLDNDDSTDLDRAVVRTDTTLDDESDAARVARATMGAVEAVE